MKYAAAFARAGGGRVVLFSVQAGRVPANLMTMPAHVLEEEENQWLLQLRNESNGCCPILYSKGWSRAGHRRGRAGAGDCAGVRDYDIDLVTIVTHGRKGLSRALWGSTAEEVIAGRHAPC